MGGDALLGGRKDVVAMDSSIDHAVLYVGRSLIFFFFRGNGEESRALKVKGSSEVLSYRVVVSLSITTSLVCMRTFRRSLPLYLEPL